jgi:hypothetical protein
MINADEKSWNKVFEMFVHESDANEKSKLMKGLASIRTPFRLRKYSHTTVVDFICILSFTIPD